MKLKLLFLSLLSLFLFSCDKDDPIIPNEEELITTFIVSLQNTSNGDLVELKFQDLDGDGGNSPVFQGGTLMPNSTYTASLSLLNEQSNPADNITNEVLTEGIDHQFFFTNTLTGLNINYSDQDSNGQPIGLQSTWTTNGESTGSVTIILRHEGDKSAEGVASGNIANAGGETDIEVTFDVQIQ